MKRNLILMSALFAGSMIVNDGFCRIFCDPRYYQRTNNNDFSWVDDDNEPLSMSDDYFETESEIDETENSPKKELNDKIKKEFLAELKTAEGLEDVVSICNSFKNQINKYKNLYSSDTIDSLNKFLNKKIYNTVKEILRSDPADVVNQHVQYIWDTINWLNKNDKNTVIKNSEAYNDCLYYCQKYLRDCTELYSLGLRNYDLPLLKESFLNAKNYFYQIIKEDNDDRAISRILDNELSGFISAVSVAKTLEEIEQITKKFNETAKKYDSYKDAVYKFSEKFAIEEGKRTLTLQEIIDELSDLVEDVEKASTFEKIAQITEKFKQAAEKYSSFKDIVNAATDEFIRAKEENTRYLTDLHAELSKFVEDVAVAETFEDIKQITKDFKRTANKFSSNKNVVNKFRENFETAKKISVAVINDLKNLNNELPKFVENVKTAETLEEIAQITKKFNEAAEKYSTYKDDVQKIREDFEAAKKISVDVINLNNELSKFFEDIAHAETLKKIDQITKDFEQAAEKYSSSYKDLVKEFREDFNQQRNDSISRITSTSRTKSTFKIIGRIGGEIALFAGATYLLQQQPEVLSSVATSVATLATVAYSGIKSYIGSLNFSNPFNFSRNMNSTNVVVPSLVTQERGTRLFPQYTNSTALIPYGKIGYEMPSDICIPQNSTAFTELTTSYEEAGNETSSDILVPQDSTFTELTTSYGEAGNETSSDICVPQDSTMDYSYVMAPNWDENYIYSDMLKKQRKQEKKSSKALVVYNHQ